MTVSVTFVSGGELYEFSTDLLRSQLIVDGITDLGTLTLSLTQIRYSIPPITANVGEQADITVLLDSGVDAQGWSIAICPPSELLTLTATVPSAGDYNYSSTNIETDRVVAGVIVDFTGVLVLAPSVSFPLLDISFDLVSPPTNGSEYLIPFCEGGFPEVNNELAPFFTSDAFPATTIDGVITTP